MSNGIVCGYGNGGFGASDSVPHGQMVTILWRYDGRKAADHERPGSDVSSIHNDALPAVCWAMASGIAGWAGSRFSPMAGASRVQVASMFYRDLNGKETAQAPVSPVRTCNYGCQGPIVCMTY